MKVCLDAGHYGKYNRSRVVGGYYESEMNWKLQGFLAQELGAYGIDVITTRSEPAKDLGLVARGKKSAGCDLFLSLHSNACDTESIDYPLVVTMQDGKGDALGLAIAQKIQALMGTTQQGKITKKKGTYGGEWYSVLEGARQVGTMGMIIEHSFHTNEKAARWLMEEENLRTLGKEEARIIAAHFGVKKDEERKQYCLRLGSYTRQEAENVAKKLEEMGYLPQVEEVAAPVEAWVPAVGQKVFFFGEGQYLSANGKDRKAAQAGSAYITAVLPGAEHPYHLQRNGNVGPWGWVDAGSFRKGEA